MSFHQFFSEQRDREADELIATLDPDHTNKVTFDAYVKDTYGDFDMTKIDNVINADPRLRETRRVREKNRMISIFSFCCCCLDIFSRQTKMGISR